MKKIISIISALAIAAGAFAKNITELRTEFEVEYKKGWSETVAFMNANSADIKAAWDSYKTTADAKKSDYILDRRIFSIAYCAGQELTGSDWVLCCLHAETWARAKIADNPTFYDELKAGGWVVEGNKMTQSQISSAAYAAKDFSYFETAPVEAYSDFYWDNGSIFRFFANNLLAMSDVSKAKEICNKIETSLLLRGDKESTLKQVQGLSKALTARLLDAKLAK